MAARSRVGAFGTSNKPARFARCRGVKNILRRTKETSAGTKTGHDARAARQRADAAREPASSRRLEAHARGRHGARAPHRTNSERRPAARWLTSDYCGLLVCSHAGLTHGPLARPVDKSHTIVAEFLHRRPQCQPEPQGAWLPSSGQPVGWIWPVLCWRFHRSTVYESGYGMPSDGKKLQWN